MFAPFRMQIDDELQQRRIPNAAVVGIHGVRKIRRLLAEILENDAVVDLVEKLAQHSGLHMTPQIGSTPDHLSDNVVIGHIPLQRHGAVVSTGDQSIYVASHGRLIVADGQVQIALHL